jgi:uncharacterized RDD family membrane protein YckC
VADGEERGDTGVSPVTSNPSRKLPGPDDFPETGRNSLAAPGPRFGARGLDLVVVAAPAMAVAGLSVNVVEGQWQMDLPGWLPWLVLAVGVVYETLSVAVWGRTLGMWVFGLRVARYTDGQRPGPDQAVLRALVPWAALATPLPFNISAAIVVGLWATGIGGGALHRGVPDQAAGTIVITTR